MRRVVVGAILVLGARSALGIVGGVIGLIAGAVGEDAWQPVAVQVDAR